VDTNELPPVAAVAWRFFERLSAGDGDGALDLFAEDGTFWTNTFRVAIPAAMVKPIMGELLAFCPMQFVLDRWLVSGDVAIFEATATATTAEGAAYHNEYAFHLDVRDGRIAAFREYADTKHAHDVIPMDRIAAALGM
jgi:ketosteroid isomerase-like protein